MKFRAQQRVELMHRLDLQLQQLDAKAQSEASEELKEAFGIDEEGAKA